MLVGGADAHMDSSGLPKRTSDGDEPNQKRFRGNDIDDDTLLCELNQISGTIEKILLGSTLEFNSWCLQKTLDENMSGLVDIMRLSSTTVMGKDELPEGSISEIYSPPRIAPLAPKVGLQTGDSFDIRTHDQDGQAWDFSNAQQRLKAYNHICKTRPLLVIGSPMCTMFSKLMGLNRQKMGEARYQRAYKEAVSHIEFALDIYKLQADGGRYYLHEHPTSASSWDLPQVRDFIMQYDAELSQMDMCTAGMEIDGLPVLKPTTWMTNSPELAKALRSRCPRNHAHTQIKGGSRSKHAQVYRAPLCNRIVHAFRRQLLADARLPQSVQKPGGTGTPPCRLEPPTCGATWGQASPGSANSSVRLLESIDGSSTNYVEACAHEVGCCGDGLDFAKTLGINLDILNSEMVLDGDLADDDGSQWQAYDDVKGGELPAKLVMDARKRELKYLADRHVYEYASTAQAYQRTHKRPLRLKWIDSNKGDAAHPNVRSRLVCTEVRPKGTDAIFAATPPLESLRALMVLLSQENPTGLDDPLCLTLSDVSRATLLCPGSPGGLYSITS